MEFSTGRNPFEYFLKDRGQDGNKGFEKLFKDLLKKEDEVAAAYQ